MTERPAPDFDPYALLDHPELAKAPGVHDGKRTEPCLCTSDDSSSSHDAQHPGEYRNDYGDWEICGWCDGRAFRYADCTRCDGSGLEPASPARGDGGGIERSEGHDVHYERCHSTTCPCYLDGLTAATPDHPGENGEQA